MTIGHWILVWLIVSLALARFVGICIERGGRE
jgi:hypothetical protein